MKKECNALYVSQGIKYLFFGLFIMLFFVSTNGFANSCKALNSSGEITSIQNSTLRNCKRCSIGTTGCYWSNGFPDDISNNNATTIFIARDDEIIIATTIEGGNTKATDVTQIP